MNIRRTNEILSNELPKLAFKVCSTRRYLVDYSYRIERFRNRPMMEALTNIGAVSKNRKLKSFAKAYNNYVTTLYGGFNKFYNPYMVDRYICSCSSPAELLDIVDDIYRGHVASKAAIGLHRNPLVIERPTMDSLTKFSTIEASTLSSAFAEGFLKRSKDLDSLISAATLIKVLALYSVLFLVLYMFNGGFVTSIMATTLIMVLLAMSILMFNMLKDSKGLSISSENGRVYKLLYQERLRDEPTELSSVEHVNIGLTTDLNLDGLNALLPGNLLTNLECVLDAITPVAEELISKNAITTHPSEIDPKSPRDVENYVLRLNLVATTYNRGFTK